MIAAKNAKVVKADWKTVKLGEISVDGGHYGIGAPAVEYDERLPTYLRITDIRDDGSICKEGLKSVDSEDAEEYYLKPNDLVIARTGASTGRNYFYDGRDGDFVYAGFLIKFSIDENKIWPPYVKYWLKGDEYRSWLNNHTDGSTRANINAVTLAECPIRVPESLPTQRKIAAVLGALDDKIENNRKICANLEAEAQALFKSWFVDFEPWGGKMPKDWKEFKLSDIAEFYGGYSYKGSELQESSCAMATIKNYERGGGFKLDGFKEIVPSEKLKTYHEVDLFDTIVAHTDLTQKAEVIGNAEMLLSKAGYEKIIMSMDLVKVLPKSGISKFLLGALLKNPIFKSHCLRYVNGTTVLHLSKMALQEYALYLPSKIDDLKNVEKLFEGVARKQAFAVNESRSLAELRDALLPKLMSGELDVDDVEV